MAARRAQQRQPAGWQRYAAPVLFLLAVTIAVLLVRGSLVDGSETAPPTGPAATRTAPPTTTARGKTTTTRKRKGSAAADFYEVQPGDTFGAIAAKVGKSVDEIEALNPGVSSTSLHVGQKIRVG